jgi:hypothetical protein
LSPERAHFEKAGNMVTTFRRSQRKSHPSSMEREASRAQGLSRIRCHTVLVAHFYELMPNEELQFLSCSLSSMTSTTPATVIQAFKEALDAEGVLFHLAGRVGQLEACIQNGMARQVRTVVAGRLSASPGNRPRAPSRLQDARATQDGGWTSRERLGQPHNGLRPGRWPSHQNL